MIDFKVNNHFLEYLSDWEHRFYFLVGGYGSSKSYNTALKLVIKALNDKDRKILISRAVARTLKESCYDLMKEVIYSMELQQYFKFRTSPLSIECYNGSRFIFLGLDDPAKLKSINNVSIIWMEECSESSYDAFKELNGRLRTLNQSMHVILTSNPVSKNNWTYKHFFKDSNIDDLLLYNKRVISIGNTYYHHSTVDDNSFVPLTYIEELENLKVHDPDLYRVARKGEFGIIGERVFLNVFKETKEHVDNAIKNIPYHMRYDGLDFGFSKSYNALVRCAVDIRDNTLYIYNEFYEKGLITGELVKELETVRSSPHNIIADSSRPEVIEEIKRAGFRICGSKKGAGSILDGLQKLRSFDRIVISEECPNTYMEFKELCFAKDKNGDIQEDKFTLDPHSVNKSAEYKLGKKTGTLRCQSDLKAAA
jgi:phage terminase large subunit